MISMYFLCIYIYIFKKPTFSELFSPPRFFISKQASHLGNSHLFFGKAVSKIVPKM